MGESPNLLPGTLKLTPAGRKQLATERAEFHQIITAIQRVLDTA